MIKGISFDKDGTIIRYNESWQLATIDFLKKKSTEIDTNEIDEIMISLGITGNQISDESPLASGTSADIAEVISEKLGLEYTRLLSELREHFFQWSKGYPSSIQGIGNLPDLFSKLKEEGYHLGIATADDYDLTAYTLKLLNIDKYFDFLGTSDRYAKKPSGEMLEEFSEVCQIACNEIIHVGDSLTDIEFSKHCSGGIGVLSGVGKEEFLSVEAMAILEDIHGLPKLLKKINP